MNDHDALLRAIGEQPEEDTPRLMYADWLEEHGESDRADFVRNQVELGRGDANGAERYRLVKKNVYYLTNFAPRWKAELPRISGVEWGDFSRGLIEEVLAASEKPVVAHAPKIFAVPGIHVLRLRELGNGERLARRVNLSRLRGLKLIGAWCRGSSLRGLLESPYLDRITLLDLHGNSAEDAIAADLASGWFPDLTELWLGENGIGDEGAEALANSVRLSKLRVLDLRDNRITDSATRTALRRRFGSALKL